MRKSLAPNLAALAALLVGCAGSSSPPRPPEPSAPPETVEASARPAPSVESAPDSGAPDAGTMPPRRAWTAEDRRRLDAYLAQQAALHPEAKYFSAVHDRIHPIFTDGFLTSLDSLPATDSKNDPHLVTKLEIVIAKNGDLRGAVVVESSGLAEFDAAAIDSVKRAAPFAAPPAAILASDGDVHLIWGFHRDGVYGCSAMDVRLRR